MGILLNTKMEREEILNEKCEIGPNNIRIETQLTLKDLGG